MASSGVQLDGYQPADRHFAAGLAADAADADLWVEVDDRRFQFVTEWDRRGRGSLLTSLRAIGPEPSDARSPAADTDAIPALVVEAVEGATYRYVAPDASAPGPHRLRHITDVVENRGRLVALLLPGDGVIVPLRKVLHDTATGEIEFVEFRDRCSAELRR